jgi:hypothetical protein
MSTLADLREKVRERADMQSSHFIEDPELNGYINNSYGELYDLLVSRYEDYYCKDPLSFTLTTLNYFIIPSDLYKIRGIDVSIQGEWADVFAYNFLDRNRYSNVIRPTLRLPPVRYRLMGQKLIFTPAQDAPGVYQLWYIPRYTPLSLDTDILSDVLDFEEYIIVDSAIKCRIKEETDIQDLVYCKEKLEKRIEALGSNRDSQPQTVGDARTRASYSSYSNVGWF